LKTSSLQRETFTEAQQAKNWLKQYFNLGFFIKSVSSFFLDLTVKLTGSAAFV
jgi:hypothetical protein